MLTAKPALGLATCAISPYPMPDLMLCCHCLATLKNFIFGQMFGKWNPMRQWRICVSRGTTQIVPLCLLAPFMYSICDAPWPSMYGIHRDSRGAQGMHAALLEGACIEKWNKNNWVLCRISTVVIRINYICVAWFLCIRVQCSCICIKDLHSTI